jgi:hypothetical protein
MIPVEPRPALVPAAPRASGDYLLIRRSDLMAKPTSGAGWTYLKSQADAKWEAPDLSKLNTTTPAQVMAAALVYARTGDESAATTRVSDRVRGRLTGATSARRGASRS